MTIVAIVAIAVAGCSSPQRIDGTGQRAAPPGGWTDYCNRHAEDPSC
jgi:hypothetical protein